MVNTVTTYRSPVRLVKHTAEDVDVYSSQAISRARKKMMAEIALAGDEVVIDDVAYSRNDASTLLDVITEDNWKTHSIIYTQKGLLNFLEKEGFNDEEMRKADAYLYNSQFVSAVSPYFAHSFNVVSGKLIRQENFDELFKLLNYQGYILPEHSHEAYQKIRTCLDELNYTLRNLSWEKFSADESILHFIFSDEWRHFINKLPSAFTTLRDELVEHMIGIVLRFQHKATWYYLHRVLMQLKGIETNDFNRSEIERIDKVIYENSKIEGNRGTRTTPRNDDEVSTGRIIWWAVWIVLIIIRVATCNNRTSSSDRYSFDTPESDRLQRVLTSRVDEKRNEPLVLNFLDSVSRKRSLAIDPLPEPMKTGDQPLATFADDFTSWGGHKVSFTNNTNYDCIVLHFSGPGRAGSVYEGALSQIKAAYIKSGESYSVEVSPNTGAFHFVFGEKWGKLKEQKDLTIFGERGLSNKGGRQFTIPLYEFFSNKKPLEQRYLQRAVYIEGASSSRDEEAYKYLNTSTASDEDEGTNVILKEESRQFSIEAKGNLQVKEDRTIRQ